MVKIEFPSATIWTLETPSDKIPYSERCPHIEILYLNDEKKVCTDLLKSEYMLDIYTQTWSGNDRMLNLAEKCGFELVDREIEAFITR